MMLQVTFHPAVVICFMAIYSVVQAREHGNCSWSHHGETSCFHNVNDVVQLHVYAVVNPCSDPLDVTFSLQATNMSWTWEYTFVNADETQPLQGLPWDLALHVILRPLPKGGTFIHAQFLEDGMPLQRFMDQTVPPQSCHRRNNFSQYLPLIIFIILVAMSVFLVGAMIIYRRQQHRKTTNRLLYHMEISPQQPYQEEPITSQYADNMATTVIKNSVYRDSTILDREANGTALPAGAEGGITQDRTQGALPKKTKTKKKKSKRKEKLKELIPASPKKEKEEVVLRVDFLR